MRPAAVKVVSDPPTPRQNVGTFFPPWHSVFFDFLVPIVCSPIYTTYTMTSGMMGGAIKGTRRATPRFVASPRLAQPASDPALVCRSQASSKALLDWMVANGAPKQAGTSPGSPLTEEFSTSSFPLVGGPCLRRSSPAKAHSTLVLRRRLHPCDSDA